MFSKEDGSPFTGTVEFDGGLFGDGSLDGVVFELDVSNGEMHRDSIRVTTGLDYFEDLDTEFWLAEALNFVDDHDVFNAKGSDEQIGNDAWKHQTEQTVQMMDVEAFN